jgi:hypothetical protein
LELFVVDVGAGTKYCHFDVSRDTKQIVKYLDDLIAYNTALIRVSTQAQADSASNLPGLGPASILGTAFGPC